MGTSLQGYRHAVIDKATSPLSIYWVQHYCWSSYHLPFIINFLVLYPERLPFNPEYSKKGPHPVILSAKEKRNPFMGFFFKFIAYKSTAD